MRTLLRHGLLLMTTLAGLAACGGGGDTPPPPVPPPASVWEAVDTAAAAGYRQGGIAGMSLAVYDRTGHLVFSKSYGDFAPSRRVAVASASKLVSGIVILRLVEQGYLSLDSTTAQILGWSGPQGQVTLRQLLSFTSGLEPDPPCTSQLLVTLAQCVADIALLPPVAAPGTRFDYGSGHLHVAARMAEVITGASWEAILQQQLRGPLGLPAQFTYYTAPRQPLGTSNPLIAGGLRASMDEYALLLGLVYARGSFGGQQLIATALMDQQGREPYPNVVIGNSPVQQLGLPYRYGLTAWLECATPATGCNVLSSAGTFGFTPWVDRDSNYYAILGMELPEAGSGAAFSVPLQQQLKPLIRTAIASL
jgi:CubicO group peptidase (beta-lactamase class C family)